MINVLKELGFEEQKQKFLANSIGIYIKEYKATNAIIASYINTNFVSGLSKRPSGSESSSDSFSLYESMICPPLPRKRNFSPIIRLFLPLCLNLNNSLLLKSFLFVLSPKSLFISLFSISVFLLLLLFLLYFTFLILTVLHFLSPYILLFSLFNSKSSKNFIENFLFIFPIELFVLILLSILSKRVLIS